MFNIIWNLFIVLSEYQAGKYVFITRPDQKDLLIEGMEKEDEGNYQCTVRAGDFQWTSKQIYVEYKGIYH